MTLHCTIGSYWGPRCETPVEIAARWRKMLAEIAELAPIFGYSELGSSNRFVPIDQLAGEPLVKLVKSRVARADDWTPTPTAGYQTFANVAPPDDPRSIHIRVFAGECYPTNYYTNRAIISTKALDDNNSAFLTPVLLKQLMLALIAGWQPTWCGLYPSDLMDLWRKPFPRRPRFDLAWITYLSSRFAAMVVPPPSLPAERTPDGGLMMIATEDRFETANPAHIAAARLIEAAIAPVNALPWPPDVEPEAAAPRGSPT